MSDRTTWQSLMELCCRKGRTAAALQVTYRDFFPPLWVCFAFDSSHTSSLREVAVLFG